MAFFNEHHCGIEEAKAALYLLDDRRKQALKCHVNAFRHICDLAYQASRSFRDQQEIENDLNVFYMRKLASISNITAILRRLDDVPEAKNYALVLCTHVRNIHEACEVYEIIIESTNDKQLKKEKLGEYAEYCLEWGRYEKATALLQRRLSLEKESFDNYMGTIQKLTNLAKDRNSYLDRYQENLTNWSRLHEEDSTLNDYLGELEIIVNE